MCSDTPETNWLKNLIVYLAKLHMIWASSPKKLNSNFEVWLQSDCLQEENFIFKINNIIVTTVATKNQLNHFIQQKLILHTS